MISKYWELITEVLNVFKHTTPIYATFAELSLSQSLVLRCQLMFISNRSYEYVWIGVVTVHTWYWLEALEAGNFFNCTFNYSSCLHRRSLALLLSFLHKNCALLIFQIKPSRNNYFKSTTLQLNKLQTTKYQFVKLNKTTTELSDG